MASEQQHLLPDGRRLGHTRYGDPAGPSVIYMHGFPASRLEAKLLDEAGWEIGVSLIAPDRPGLGLSDFQPGRAITDWPADVAHLADALDLDRFYVVGVSGGCPYALACAHQLGDRVIRTAIIAGMGPSTGEVSIRGMGSAARLGFFLARRAPAIFNIAYTGLGRLIMRHPDLIFRLNEATAPDQEVLERSEVRSVIIASVQEAFRSGTAGAVHDFALLAKGWGFEPGEIVAPVHVWRGRQDGVVPASIGKFMAERMPNSHLTLLPGEGHVSLTVRFGAEILKSSILLSDPAPPVRH